MITSFHFFWQTCENCETTWLADLKSERDLSENFYRNLDYVNEKDAYCPRCFSTSFKSVEIPDYKPPLQYPSDEQG
jgi:hypothetical protein